MRTFIGFLLSAVLVSVLTEAAMSCADRYPGVIQGPCEKALPSGYRDAYDAGR